MSGWKIGWIRSAGSESRGVAFRIQECLSVAMHIAAYHHGDDHGNNAQNVGDQEDIAPVQDLSAERVIWQASEADLAIKRHAKSSKNDVIWMRICFDVLSFTKASFFQCFSPIFF